MYFKVVQILVLFLTMGLTGCSNHTNNYNESIDNGMESITMEEYDQAKSHFEAALEEKPEDERVQNILDQLAAYQEAVQYMENNEMEKALKQAELSSEVTNGSKELNERSKALIKEIQELLEKRRVKQEEEKKSKQASIEEQKNKELAEAEERAEATEESETKATTKADETNEVEEAPYDYNDFIGYYLHFDSNDRSHADMNVTIGHEYITIGWYLSEFELYNVLDTSLAENVLSIDYSTVPYGEEAEEYGTFEVSLNEENGEKSITFDVSGMTFYQVTYEEVLDYGYTIQDYLVEDMNQ